MSEETVSMSGELDVFSNKAIQTAVLETIGTVYKPIAPVEQISLKFLIPDYLDNYIDLVIKLNIRGKLISGDGKYLDTTDFTALNNYLHTLYSQCSVTLNFVSIT